MTNIESIVTDSLERLRIDIISRHLAAGQRASGRTAKSLEVVAHPTGGVLLGASYFGVLEEGRKPGKTPYNFESIIKEWATDKGISFESEEEADRFAKHVAWKIRKFGTKLYRTKKEDPKDIFTSSITKFTDVLVKDLGAYVANEIFNFNNKIKVDL